MFGLDQIEKRNLLLRDSRGVDVSYNTWTSRVTIGDLRYRVQISDDGMVKL